ncbi:hypothetical protein NPIL_545311 [Nephila pilipes]|uniref:Uncharacterized protein n=1 Tax=Nephila pilipes TaxID=299642 RepID=A0A8X6UL97_NEPPI|nr:hypothetical protein NPIL_545311 [Nephila pilipes]
MPLKTLRLVGLKCVKSVEALSPYIGKWCGSLERDVIFFPLNSHAPSVLQIASPQTGELHPARLTLSRFLFHPGFSDISNVPVQSPQGLSGKVLLCSLATLGTEGLE